MAQRKFEAALLDLIKEYSQAEGLTKEEAMTIAQKILKQHQ